MSWVQKLAQTYDIFADEAGKQPAEGKVPLLPLFHSTQQAQIECAVDTEGNYLYGRGRILTEKREQTTIIPVTEKSSSRTAAPAPHPLFDKLQYLAGDFLVYGGTEKAFAHEAYLNLLQSWCAAPHCPRRVKAVLCYMQSGTLIHDLVQDGLLTVDENGVLPEKWKNKEEEAPKIYSTGIAPLSAFVRVDVVDESEKTPLWKDVAVRESWIRLQRETAPKMDYCYASGNYIAVEELSPKKIRNAGDGAKLISANDSSGFTFRGRFDLPEEAYCIGKEVSEKAHSALRWLISRQGYYSGGQVILAWIVDPVQLPRDILLGDTFDLVVDAQKDDLFAGEEWDDYHIPDETLSSVHIPQDGYSFARRFRKALAGYAARLDEADEAVIMGLDAATPGRLSIFYYSELPGKELIGRVQKWHESCAWLLQYKSERTGEDDKGKPIYERISFYGAPALRDIIEAAYGERMDDKLKASAMKRLLPCITDGARLPQDIMLSAFHRASNPMAMERWQADKALSIACALVRKHYNDKSGKHTAEHKKKEEWTLMVNNDCEQRSYLFGRAWAYARRIEESALYYAEEKPRQTNAEKLQTAFVQHPARTWEVMNQQLTPYLDRLRVKNPGTAHYLEAGMRELLGRISLEDFTNKEPLSPIYVLGYSSQLSALWKKKDEETQEEE